MKQTLIKTAIALFLTGTLTQPILVAAQEHHDDDHRYYDKQHKDYHQWNDHEDRAYHMYFEQRHRPYVAFETLNQRQQSDYWAWRHSHSDALLKIDIH